MFIYKFSATVDSASLTNTLSIPLTSGAVDRTQSTIAVSPSSIVANGSSVSVVTVTLKDSLGNQLTTGGSTVVISATRGTLLGSVNDNGNGTYSQVLRSSTLAGSGTLSFTVNSLSSPNTASYSFIPGAASLSQSRVIANPSTVIPDGASQSSISVILKDANGNALTSSAGTVALSTTTGTWAGAITDNNDGSYSRTLVAPSSPSTATVSATLNSSANSSTYPNRNRE
jgi:adhesin/invasin